MHLAHRVGAALSAGVLFFLLMLTIPTTAAATGSHLSAGLSFNPPDICPPGFARATPPLNPALGCLPTNFFIPTRNDGTLDIPPDGFCPEGWRPVTPPLNPLLVCLPDTIAQPTFGRISHSLRLPQLGSLHCPRGWEAVTKPLNEALICLPRSILAELPDPSRSDVPDGFCPEGWRPVTPPLNPVLGCLPNNVKAE